MIGVDKTWPLEKVTALQRELQQQREADPNDVRGDDFEARDDPLPQWRAMHKLDQLEKAYLSGNGFALMEGLALCATHNLIIPDWVALAFLERFRKVQSFEVGSWDDAFGQPFPRKHIDALRLQRNLKFSVLITVRDLVLLEGHPRDEGTFEEAARRLRQRGMRVGKTKIKAIWYDPVDVWARAFRAYVDGEGTATLDGSPDSEAAFIAAHGRLYPLNE